MMTLVILLYVLLAVALAYFAHMFCKAVRQITSGTRQALQLRAERRVMGQAEAARDQVSAVLDAAKRQMSAVSRDGKSDWLFW